jgi:hypothetical protein
MLLPVEQSVWPSAVDLAQASAAMMPSAPTRFSITMVCPRAFPSGSSMPRASVSVGPPGGAYAMMRNVVPCASTPPANAKHANIQNNVPRIEVSPAEKMTSIRASVKAY